MTFIRGSFIFLYILVIILNTIHQYLFDNIDNVCMISKFLSSKIFVSTKGYGYIENIVENIPQIENRKIINILQHDEIINQVNHNTNYKDTLYKQHNKKSKNRIKIKSPQRKSHPNLVKVKNNINFNEIKNSHEINSNDSLFKTDEIKKEEVSEKKECKGSAKNCIRAKVKSLINVMKGMEINKNEKENSNLDREENIYDDEHHTVIVFDGIDENKDLYNKYKNIKKNTNGMDSIVIQGTEYLGVGYDFIFGNPIGDPFLKVDPGYRDSIIKLTYPKSDEDYPDNYMNINPNGSFVRNEISCNRSEKESEISTMSEYTKELSVDASIGASYGLFGSFSASTGYKSVSNTISKNKFRMFMLKSYCFKYVASLSQYSQWKLTDQFVRAISLLPSHFNSLEKDGTYCTDEEFRDNRKSEKCGKSVTAWMYFFKNFGTHVSTLLHLGGKITQQVKISKNDYKAMTESGLSVSASVSAGFGLFKVKGSTNTESNESSNEESSTSSLEKETVIIGGTTIFDPNDPNNFEKWAESITENPMPIKGEYEPLSRILPTRLSKIYEEALRFYISVNVPSNFGQITDNEIRQYNIKEELMKATMVHSSGTGLVVVECEEKQNFLLGFSLSIPNDLSNLKDFYLNSCDEDSDKCYSKMSDNVYSYIFAMCKEEMIPFFEQKVKSGVGLLTLECSEKNQVILFGFGISVLNTNDPISISLYPCKYGKASCSMQGSTDQSAVGLWIVCAHEESLNSKFSVYIRKMFEENVSGKKKKHMDICPEKVLFNLIFEFTKTPIKKRNGGCFTVNDKCPKDFHVCSDKKDRKSFNYYSLSVY
ncbi:perforin-like protein 3 [Plasmodium sp. gorilla clade G3]|nr:perforin-like protein 3 [Plasmodium sp. gorilla clade G3]